MCYVLVLLCLKRFKSVANLSTTSTVQPASSLKRKFYVDILKIQRGSISTIIYAGLFHEVGFAEMTSRREVEAYFADAPRTRMNNNRASAKTSLRYPEEFCQIIIAGFSRFLILIVFCVCSFLRSSGVSPFTGYVAGWFTNTKHLGAIVS